MNHRALLLLCGVLLAGCSGEEPAEPVAKLSAGAGDAAAPAETPAAPEQPAVAPPATDPIAAALAAGAVVADPPTVVLGKAPTYGSASGAVRLVNGTDQPVTLLDCKSSCGCTALQCPRQTVIEPGTKLEIDVTMNADSRPMLLSKKMTFRISGHDPLIVPIELEIVSYVDASTWDLDPREHEQLVLTAVDDTPFVITHMKPALVEQFGKEPKTRHEIALDWEQWKLLGSGRKLLFFTDHPKCNQVLVMVMVAPPE